MSTRFGFKHVKISAFAYGIPFFMIDRRYDDKPLGANSSLWAQVLGSQPWLHVSDYYCVLFGVRTGRERSITVKIPSAGFFGGAATGN